MARAIENDSLPQEFFAMKGRSAKDAIMTRTLWSDINRLQHKSFAVVSADLSQCFDMIGHPQCSLAMQAQGCPIEPISIMLRTLQDMNYWLRSAYGDAKTSFCSTSDEPYMGMGQGSGGSNPGCAFTFTPVVNAYKRKGFHPVMHSAWSRRVMLLAALSYVDDTDLLLRALENQSTQEFMELIQQAITFWGQLVLATGGVLKQSKCAVAISSVKFVAGKPTIQKPRSLPDIKFHIPQKEGKTAIIPTVGAEENVIALGFSNDLRNTGSHQMKRIKKIGKDWSINMNTNRYLHRSDVRLSLSSQLHPKLKWSIGCFSHDPKQVDKAVHSIYHQTMSRMGINRKMRRKMRMMTKKYGGLGYFNLNIDNLGDRFHFITCHWDLPTAAGQTLRHAYEIFRISVGLGGNIFERDFDHLGKLAEPCWFTHTWKLCHRFSSPIEFGNEFEVPLMRERDIALIDSFIDTGIWQIADLLILNSE